MKKVSLVLALSTKLFGTCALANTISALPVNSGQFNTQPTNTQSIDAPAMRGEITQNISNPHNANILTTKIAGVPSINANVSNLKLVPTVIIKANKSGTKQLDVSLLDDFLDDIAPNARHYPTNFPNRTTEYLAGENLKYLSDWIEPYASAADASFDVVLRAAKINHMARNLNVGKETNTRVARHMAKAVALSPNDVEANYLFGVMLSESGGFKESKKYLDKAVSLGSIEAEQSLAQVDVLTDNTPGAIRRLQALQAKHPNHPQLAEQISMLQNGKYYIFSIKDNDVNLKPLK